MRTRKDTVAAAEPGDGRLDAAAQEAIERFARVMSRCGICAENIGPRLCECRCRARRHRPP